MKKLIFFISILSVSIAFSQSDVVAILKEKQKLSPTDVIIYADSLLFYNSEYDASFIFKIKYEKALAYQNNNNHKKALQLFDEISSNLNKNESLFINTLLLQSNSNVYLKKYTTATNQALEALNLSKKNKLFDLVTSANNALSFIYYSNKEYLKAFEYLSNSVTLQKQQKDSIKLSATYNNIAIIFKNTDNLEQALSYNQKSLEISVLNDNRIGMGKSYSNIGRIYELQGNQEEALKYYNKAIDNNLKSKILNSIPYSNKGDIYAYIKDYKLAEKNYLKALKIEIKNENNAKIHRIYKDLLKTAIQQKNFKKALSFQTKLEEITSVKILHENEEKIKMLANQHKLFQKKNQLEELKKSKTKNQVFFVVLISFLLLLSLYLFQSIKKRALKIEKEKLVLEQSILRSQMNPHFIFNTLAAIQNSLLDNDVIKSATYLSRFSKLIRQNFDFVNQKTILLSEEIDALKNYMDTQKLRFNNKFDYKINLLDVDPNGVEIPPLLIQPFVENSIEHGFKNKTSQGEITINISKKKNHICYEVIDNGKGYSNAKADNKTHAIDVFKKRIKLYNNDEASFAITSSNLGTTVKFKIKQ